MIKTPQIFDIVKIYIQWFSLYCTIWQGITCPYLACYYFSYLVTCTANLDHYRDKFYGGMGIV